MDPRHRDGLLALLALAGLGGVAAIAGIRVPLFDPFAVAVGVTGTLLLEAAFLQSERLARIWGTSRALRAGALFLVLAGAIVLARVAGAWTLAALTWGLLAYLVLLGLVLAGLGNPAVRLLPSGRQ